MIFAYTLDKVLSQEKWQTRRVAKPNERLFIEEKLSGQQKFVSGSGKRKVFEVGKSYAVQPNRGKKGIARIMITGIRSQPVWAISERDAHAEGFGSREEFLTTWRTIHGHRANLNRTVWVLEFTLQDTMCGDLRALYERRISAN